jgi:signal transduction histidine kinase
MASPKRAPKRKLTKLNEQAFNQIETNAEEIAKALCDSTKKGNVISACLLVELAQDQMETEEVSMKQQVQTIAQRLAKEKEWQGPPLTPEEEALATGVPFL